MTFTLDLKPKKIGMIVVTLIGVFLLVPAAQVHAHRVNVFAWVEGDTVHTESSFPGGREVIDGKIVVYDENTGEKLLEGQTDDKGKFSFPIPRKTALRIELTAGMGHKNEWIVPEEEIAAVGEVPASGGGGSGKKTEAAPEIKPAAPASGIPAASSKQIEAAVEKALDRRLSPVVKMIAESRRRPISFQDVFGGIGYIFGLAGLGAYIHYRKKIKELESR